MNFGIKSDDGIDYIAGESGIIGNGFKLRGGVAVGKDVIKCNVA